jgi:hypothetical protein
MSVSEAWKDESLLLSRGQSDGADRLFGDLVDCAEESGTVFCIAVSGEVAEDSEGGWLHVVAGELAPGTMEAMRLERVWSSWLVVACWLWVASMSCCCCRRLVCIKVSSIFD